MRILVTFVLLLLAANGAAAQGAPDLRGAWTVRPYEWQGSGWAQGCLYQQWVDVERRVNPGRFAGTSRQQVICGDGRRSHSERQVTLLVDGDQITVTSPSESWHDEYLRYVSPTRMEGSDRFEHNIVYERRAEPTS